jgi:hypothetical protein
MYFVQFQVFSYRDKESCQCLYCAFSPRRFKQHKEMILQIQWQDYRFGAVIVYLVVE